MFCMNCGQQLPDGAKFCMICGTPLGGVTPMGLTNSVSVPATDTPINNDSVTSATKDINEDSSSKIVSPFVPLGSTQQVAPSPFVPLGTINNSDFKASTASFVPAMCPNCSAHMRVDTSSKVARCDSCGTECLVQEAIRTLNVNGNVQVGNATINVNGTNTENLLQRVELMLSDGDFNGAMQKCDTILDSEPTNGRAYLYMLMSSLNCRLNSDLANQSSPFDGNPYYVKAIQYGDEELRNELLYYNRIVTSRMTSRLSSVQKGRDVFFGNSNGQDIRWKVLTVENNMALLLCSNLINEMPYYLSNSNITWENSTIRSWLNGSFFESSFTPSERTRIVTVTNNNAGSVMHFTKGGNTTNDQVFLLSLNEVKKFLPFASGRSLGKWWWLRSPGCYQNLVMAVFSDGKIHNDGYTPDKSGGVRPAIWIRIN